MKLGWHPTFRLGSLKIPFRANLRGLIRGREPLASTTSFDRSADPARVGQTQFVPAYRTWDVLFDGANNQAVNSSLPVFREPGARWRAGFQLKFGR